MQNKCLKLKVSIEYHVKIMILTNIWVSRADCNDLWKIVASHDTGFMNETYFTTM